MEDQTERELTDKRSRFIDEYLLDCNATQAAIRAGYASSGARQEGSRLLANADIRTEVDRRLSEAGMPAQEVVKHFVDIAKTRLNDFLVVRQVQGYEQEEQYLSVLVDRKREEVSFIQEFAEQEDLQLFNEFGPTDTGKRLNKAKEQLLELELEKMRHGPDAVKLVPGKPVVHEVADLDIVAIARAKQQGRIKTYKMGKEGVSVEMYAADGALEKLGRYHGIFEKDNRQTAGTDVEIVIGGSE
ncbi:terminase small subunit [Hymenobacter lapidiphilus]|uniref:Terminase small subunit n=1 Tax=Hymenobacter lapidiphilus TaxID=2608003 RepID=A0A7Y7U758_9BACT|nr:terminase small subunit [Hymenobacter lapidiphilus]NVO33223.1 terminase small subunit [Hymenobacter lapidiphilus]